MYQLVPFILSADFNRLGETDQNPGKEGIEWLHIDVWMVILYRVFLLECR